MDYINNSPVAQQYAGFWRRLVAYIIDGFVLMAIFMAIAAIAYLALIAGNPNIVREFSQPEYMERYVPYIFIFQMIWTVMSIAVQWLYFALQESSSHQATLGKRALGLKVTDINGQRLTFARATGRHFAKIISGITLGIGYLMIAFTAKKQALHDMIADCLVLR